VVARRPDSQTFSSRAAQTGVGTMRSLLIFFGGVRQKMALAFLRRWVCCEGADESSSTLRTDSKLATTNTVKIDGVTTDNKVRIERTAVDVNVNAPARFKLDGPEMVTVRHEVDVLGPIANTLSKPVVAVKKLFSRSTSTAAPLGGAPGATVVPDDVQEVRKRSATVGVRTNSASTKG